jgi:hypothetical protein
LDKKKTKNQNNRKKWINKQHKLKIKPAVSQKGKIQNKLIYSYVRTKLTSDTTNPIYVDETLGAKILLDFKANSTFIFNSC